MCSLKVSFSVHRILREVSILSQLILSNALAKGNYCGLSLCIFVLTYYYWDCEERNSKNGVQGFLKMISNTRFLVIFYAMGGFII